MRGRKENNMSKQVYDAQDVAELLGVSISKSYAYIRQMNEELKEKGYLIVRGKVLAAYLQERFFGVRSREI